MRHFFHHLKKSLANLFKGRLISNDLSCQSYQYYQNYHYSHYIQNDACIQFNDPRNYLFLYHNCTQNNFINTNIEISFSRSLKFGCSIKDIKRKFSLGKYHLQKIKDKQIEILIFKILIGNHKAKCYLHFFKGHLFYYQFSFIVSGVQLAEMRIPSLADRASQHVQSSGKHRCKRVVAILTQS